MFMNQQTPSTMSQLNMTNQSGLLRQQQMTQLYYSQMTPQGARQNSTPQTVLSYIGAPFQFPQQMIGMSPNMPVGIMNTPSNLNLSKSTSATSLPAQQELPDPDVVVPTTTDKENLVV